MLEDYNSLYQSLIKCYASVKKGKIAVTYDCLSFAFFLFIILIRDIFWIEKDSDIKLLSSFVILENQRTSV
jgi:hypothetical protein